MRPLPRCILAALLAGCIDDATPETDAGQARPESLTDPMDHTSWKVGDTRQHWNWTIRSEGPAGFYMAWEAQEDPSCSVQLRIQARNPVQAAPAYLAAFRAWVIEEGDESEIVDVLLRGGYTGPTSQSVHAGPIDTRPEESHNGTATLTASISLPSLAQELLVAVPASNPSARDPTIKVSIDCLRPVPLTDFATVHAVRLFGIEEMQGTAGVESFGNSIGILKALQHAVAGPQSFVACSAFGESGTVDVQTPTWAEEWKLAASAAHLFRQSGPGDVSVEATVAPTGTIGTIVAPPNSYVRCGFVDLAPQPAWSLSM